jgi:CheY-like chemotaxis protein
MEKSPDQNDCVLVIDDDVVMRELLALLLASANRTVLTAESGDAALALLAEQPAGKLPSVVLTDLKMPGLSEAALAIRLRLVCPLPALLIAMSGSEPAEGVVEPFDAFLRKPFTIAELEGVLEKARVKVSGKQQPRTRSGRSKSPAQVGDNRTTHPLKFPVLDETTYAKLLSVMGTTQLPQLYAMFMNDAPARVARMQSAVAAHDGTTFGREAHAIKGGCGMLGATEIHFLASQMEAGGLACSSLLKDFESAFERLRRILEQRMMIV